MGDDALFISSPRALLTELGDGTGVVLELDTKFYFNLNRTGVVVWKALSARAEGASARMLAEALTEHFDIEVQTALDDVMKLLGDMTDEGLVKAKA